LPDPLEGAEVNVACPLLSTPSTNSDCLPPIATIPHDYVDRIVWKKMLLPVGDIDRKLISVAPVGDPLL